MELNKYVFVSLIYNVLKRILQQIKALLISKSEKPKTELKR